MRSIDRFSSPAPAKIERDDLKVIESLRNSLRTGYALVITTETGKLSGHVVDMNSISGKVKIINRATKIEFSIRDILLTE